MEDMTMKKYREIGVLLATNAGIGIASIVAIISLFIGSLYALELAENFFMRITPPSIQMALSVGLSSILALYLLAIFGSWMREKIEDIIWEIRSQRQVTK